MAATTEKIKQLREETGAGVVDCKKALEETHGDITKAKDILKKKGLEIAQKKSQRVTLQGRIESYIHHNHKIGALVEINCETDFVAKSDVFIKLGKDIAMHIVACSPAFIKKEDVHYKDVPKEQNIEDYCKRTCLLEQPFVRDEAITIGEYITSVIAKTGENIIVKKFTRFELGV